MRIGVVLSAGGLRGAAHLGVMGALVRLGLPIDVLVGVSAGAIIASYYAAVGLTIDDMVGDAPTFRGRHILMFGLGSRMPKILRPVFERLSGVIPCRLRQLESGRFDRLHHRVDTLGVVCHDPDRNRPHYFSSKQHHGLRLADVARASAAVPGVFRPRSFKLGSSDVRLVDGGLSDSLPVDFTCSDLGSTHLVISDCRRSVAAIPEPAGAQVIYIRPYLGDMGPFRSPRASLLAAVAAGKAAVTPLIEDRLRCWIEDRAHSCSDRAASHIARDPVAEAVAGAGPVRPSPPGQARAELSGA